MPKHNELPSAEQNMASPLDLMAGFDHRLGEQCATLLRLSRQLDNQRADRDSTTAMASLIEFFDVEVPNHYRDEEFDLFPALIESMAGSDAGCLHQITRALTADHRWLEAAWSPLRKPLQEAAHGATIAPNMPAVDAFVTRCHEHLERENLELLPMARRLIDDQALAQIGASMQSRHGGG